MATGILITGSVEHVFVAGIIITSSVEHAFVSCALIMSLIFFDPLQNIEKIWRALSPPSVIANEVKRPSLGWLKIILVVFSGSPHALRAFAMTGWLVGVAGCLFVFARMF